MSEFVLIFRRDYKTKEVQPSAEKFQDHLQHWQKWFGDLASNNQLARPVQRYDPIGKVLTADQIINDGPYSEVKESIGGLVIINAADYEAAIKIAKTCPVLELGGNVEIRIGL